MKKKRAVRPRKRQRRVILDFRVCVVAVGAIAVLQLLLFFAGWVSGQHAIEPMRQFAHDARVQLAAMIAPEAIRGPETVDRGPETVDREPETVDRGPEAIAAALVFRPAVPRPTAHDDPRPTDTPIQLVFEALPPLERPKPFERPMPKNFTPDFYVELIRDAALQHDVPAALVQAVVKVESDFNARAVSPKGARGLMQVMPATARRFGVADPDHLFYPAPNLNAGTAYLAWLLKRYEGNLDLALAAYNAGEGAVQQYRGIPPYRETRNYVKKVRQALGRNAA